MTQQIVGDVKVHNIPHKDTAGENVVIFDSKENILKSRTLTELKTDIGSSVLKSTGVAVTWAEDTTVDGYTHKGTVTLKGCTTDYAPFVVLPADIAASGDYCPVAESGTDCVYIWGNKTETSTDFTVDVVAVL